MRYVLSKRIITPIKLLHSRAVLCSFFIVNVKACLGRLVLYLTGCIRSSIYTVCVQYMKATKAMFFSLNVRAV